MHLRLVQFEGIHIALAPGWYELPSHMSSDDVRRLLDLLSHILPGVEDVVECQWRELGELTFGDATLAFVSVPDAITSEALSERLRSTPVHHGFYERETPGHWPELPWDEMQLKSKLAAALRKSITRPNHPLARLDIAKLPVDRLSEATSEPIELLVLAEGTVESATRQREIGQPIDWAQCVRWSIGNRLAKRLARADRRVVGRLREAIASSVEGLLRTLDWDREIDELVRLGLAHREQGDAMLVPLARMANEHGVVPILDIEGVTAPPPTRPLRERATNREQAANAFDPRHDLRAGDPWLVDLRASVPAIMNFGRSFIQQIGRRDRNMRLAVVQLPGSGGTTMIRRLLLDLAAQGVGSVSIRLPTAGKLGFVDLLLRMLSDILVHCEAERDIEILPATLTTLRAWLGEHCLDGELRDYIRLGHDVIDKARIPALLAILRRFLASAHDGDQRRERLQAGLEARIDELLGHLQMVLGDLRRSLAVRGRHLCLHIECTEHFDLATIQSLFIDHREDLERLDCHLVFAIDPRLDQTPRLAAAYDLVTFPNLASDDSSMREALRAVLDARADLHAAFPVIDEVIDEIVDHAHGSLRLALELARHVCSVDSLAEVDWDGITHDYLGTGITQLPDEWLAIQQELERRQRAGEDVGAWRASIAAAHAVGPVLQPFDLLERYRLLEELPRLPDALVWRAWDRCAGCERNLAVLRTNRVADPAWLARLNQRMQALASFEHPHVARMLGECFEFAGYRVYVMQRPSGTPLADRLAVESLPALVGIAEGIDAMHAIGLVHGEITPADIVIDEQGKAMLTGIELHAQDGSPYAPPEKDTEAVSDVYGLGACVLACSEGAAITRPMASELLIFLSRSRSAVLFGTLGEQPLLPTHLLRALEHALSTAPCERAENCSELAESLRSLPNSRISRSASTVLP